MKFKNRMMDQSFSLILLILMMMINETILLNDNNFNNVHDTTIHTPSTSSSSSSSIQSLPMINDKRTTSLIQMSSNDHQIPRRLVTRLVRQQIRRQLNQQQQYEKPEKYQSTTVQSRSTIAPSTTVTNLGRSIFELREPFGFKQDSDDELMSEHTHDHDHHQSDDCDHHLSRKLDKMIEFVENSFVKTIEKIDNLERKIYTMQNTFADSLVEFIEKSQQEYSDTRESRSKIIRDDHKKNEHTNNNGDHMNNSNNYSKNYPSILDKMYNIHQQTYQVCKDALVMPKETITNCPTMTAVCTMLKQHKQHDKYAESTNHNNNNNNRNNYQRDPSYHHRSSHHSSTIMTSSSSSPSSPLQSSKHQIIHSRSNDNDNDNEDIDGEAMREVFGMFANWTLDTYVQRIHRYLAEELNVFNFQIKEKFQSLIEKYNKMDILLKVNDQLSASMLDIRDQLLDGYQTIEKLTEKLSDKQNENYNNNKQLACAPIIFDNQTIINYQNETQNQMKKLFNEYYTKFITYLNDTSSILIKTVKTTSTAKRQTSLDTAINNNSNNNNNNAIKNMINNDYHDDHEHDNNNNNNYGNDRSNHNNINNSKANVTVKFLTYDTATIQRATTNLPSSKSSSLSLISSLTSSLSSPSPSYKSISMNDPYHRYSNNNEIKKISNLNDNLNNNIINNNNQNNDVLQLSSPLPPLFEPQTKSRSDKSKCSREANIFYPNSCDELKRNGASCNGVYVILTGASMKQVYCDMSHNDGGWTVILRRGNFSSSKYMLNFDQNFMHYRAGFGDMHAGEFWIGLEFVHQLTKNGRHLLQIDLMDFKNNFISLVYNGFSLGSKDDGYRFYVKSIRNDLLSSNNQAKWNLTELASIVFEHNNTQFMTFDHIVNTRQQTISSSKQQSFYRECSTYFRSGWWYNAPSSSSSSSIYNNVPLIDTCKHLNLFQLMAPLYQSSFSPSSHNNFYVKWNNWYADDDNNSDDNDDGIDHRYSLRKIRYVLMKIRPDN